MLDVIIIEASDDGILSTHDAAPLPCGLGLVSCIQPVHQKFQDLAASLSTNLQLGRAAASSNTILSRDLRAISLCSLVVELTCASLTKRARMSPRAGAPNTLLISAELPPSSDIGRTCTVLSKHRDSGPARLLKAVPPEKNIAPPLSDPPLHQGKPRPVPTIDPPSLFPKRPPSVTHAKLSIPQDMMQGKKNRVGQKTLINSHRGDPLIPLPSQTTPQNSTSSKTASHRQCTPSLQAENLYEPRPSAGINAGMEGMEAPMHDTKAAKGDDEAVESFWSNTSYKASP